MSDLIILRLPGVLVKTGYSRTTVYRLEAAGLFPKRVALSPNCTGWYAHEIDEYLANLPRVCSTSEA